MSTLTNKLVTILLLTFFWHVQLHADDESSPTKASSTTESSIKGDLEKGKKLAIKKCSRCHGETGISEEGDEDMPHLASQSAAYILKQLKDYKSKVRENKTMYKRAKKLSEQQMADVALWYEKQLLPEITAFSEGKIEIPQLVTQGDPSRSIPPCEACHGKMGDTVAGGISKLAGQNVGYLISTMESFIDDSRNNNTAVQDIIKKLSGVEIYALANYYAALGGRPENKKETE